MKGLFVATALLLSFVGYSQIELDYFDLPRRGHTYIKNVVPSLPASAIPADVLDSSDKKEFAWDLTEITNEAEMDTINYYWVEGTSAVFDFPDANMVDYDLEAEAPENYNYFIKKEEGFWLSGTSGGFETELGTFDIKAEFRPAVPIVMVPAMLGDEVSETSRATVSVATFGEARLTTFTDYEINGFGTLKIPGDDETHEVLRIKRVTKSDIDIEIDIFGQKIDTVTTTKETAYEFYRKNYGDYLASITFSSDGGLGEGQWSFDYKASRVVSNVISGNQEVELGLINLPSANALILISKPMIGGQYSIVNLEGKTIKSWIAQNEKELFNSSALAPGVYVIQAVDTNGNAEFKKFTIQ